MLGRILTIQGLGGHTSAPIVAIVQNLQVAQVDVPEFRLAPYSSVIVPYRDTAAMAYYVVRVTTAAQLRALRKAAPASLYAISRARVLRDVQSLSDARRRIYRADRAIIISLTTVSAILIAMTGWGVVGLSICSVSQRRRQIGIRRALGATHASIVRHFQTENLRIVGVGAVAGVGLAVAVNLWMVRHLQMDRLDYRYALLGAFIVLVLGQLATLWPALRAGSVPPAEAARRL